MASENKNVPYTIPMDNRNAPPPPYGIVGLSYSPYEHPNVKQDQKPDAGQQPTENNTVKKMASENKNVPCTIPMDNRNAPPPPYGIVGLSYSPYEQPNVKQDQKPDAGQQPTENNTVVYFPITQPTL
ncbi:hypothetical protein RR46_00340 [Papilio xuthus]|uniref:Uncharacterized protein n=1 Tax=Papilio xuthus TaxID=66420 RepID=A0A0N1ICD2_PAPXU|nr:hypothetical protein RR46_00340 [Papilio xuthus]